MERNQKKDFPVTWFISYPHSYIWHPYPYVYIMDFFFPNEEGMVFQGQRTEKSPLAEYLLYANEMVPRLFFDRLLSL